MQVSAAPSGFSRPLTPLCADPDLLHTTATLSTCSDLDLLQEPLETLPRRLLNVLKNTLNTF